MRRTIRNDEKCELCGKRAGYEHEFSCLGMPRDRRSAIVEASKIASAAESAARDASNAAGKARLEGVSAEKLAELQATSKAARDEAWRLSQKANRL